MTAAKHGGMNPESGIKIVSFNTGKEQEVQAYKNERDALFRAMRHDMENI